MAYIGKGPAEVLSGAASKSNFTGDGSTTTFDISTDIPAGGENDIQVFVDNVRQEPGSSASYTVGVDGSGNLRRITFNVAPEASQSIYVINPRRIEAYGAIPDNIVATATLQADAVTSAKIADDSISDEHLDVTSITGQTELAETAADDDLLLIYDTSTTALKKIQKQYVGVNINTTTALAEEPASGDKVLIYDTSAGTNKAVEYQYINPSLTYTNGTFTGDGSTQGFTIDSGRAVDDVLVHVNGFLLVPTDDYTISGTTLTFTTAPASSAEISVRYLPLAGASSYTNDTATGDGSTQAFTIDSGRSVEDIMVSVNGVTLVPTTDYTISGTTLTFTTAPAASAEISIRYLRLT